MLQSPSRPPGRSFPLLFFPSLVGGTHLVRLPSSALHLVSYSILPFFFSMPSMESCFSLLRERSPPASPLPQSEEDDVSPRSSFLCLFFSFPSPAVDSPFAGFPRAQELRRLPPNPLNFFFFPFRHEVGTDIPLLVSLFSPPRRL